MKNTEIRHIFCMFFFMSLLALFSGPAASIREYSRAIGVVSQNVANVSSIGYKRTDSVFAETLAREARSIGNGGRYGGSGVNSDLFYRNDREGTIQTTLNSLDMAISGNGYFPTLNNGQLELTAAGSFSTKSIIENGAERTYLVDVKNNYLLGSKIDPVTRQEPRNINNVAELTQIDVTAANNILPAKATENISMNLLLETSAVKGKQFKAPLQIFTGQNQTSAETLGMQLTRLAPTNDNRSIDWELDIAPSSATVSNVAVVQPTNSNNIVNPTTKKIKFTYSNSGQLLSPKELNVTFDYPARDGQQAFQRTVNFKFDSNLFTTSSTLTSFSIDGHSRGELQSYRFSERGTLEATFTNNEVRDLYRIPVARVPNQNSMTRLDNTHFKANQDSGAVNFTLITPTNNNTGQIKFTPSGLEASNVELAVEFVDLIEYQRSLQFNSRVLTTVNEFVQTATNLKR